MTTSHRSVITLANSIIGVSILAMPFCFKQCGIILATVMLLLCGMMVKVTCHLLLKSAKLARRRNFEFLAFHTFGAPGKLFIEIGIAGFLGGTAIAFFVVLGDLGPPLIANMAGIESSANLRLVILTGLGLFVALPLSFMRNIESLSVICTTSIGFYLLVVVRVVLQASSTLSTWDWLSNVNLWRPAGMLQCFPIFSMALSCQANVFEVYASLKGATAGDMNDVVRGAVNLCTGIYITIGFFGYVAFCQDEILGNVLTMFPPSRLLDVIKLGFVVSVAVSFPLVVFPCRTSVHSLFFRKTYKGIESTELVTDYIPPSQFNIITVSIIVISLIIGILIPDIELVLGLVGSTMGSAISIVFPAAVFIKLTTKDTTERVAAKAVFFIGLVTIILGTYVNLFEHNSSPTPAPKIANSGNVGDKPAPMVPGPGGNNAARIDNIADTVLKNISDAKAKLEGDTNKDEKKPVLNKNDATGQKGEKESKRQEPVVPEAPKDVATDVAAKVDSGNEPKEGSITSKETSVDADVDELKKAVADLKSVSKNKTEPDEVKVRQKKAKKEKKAEELLAELEKQKHEQKKIIEQQKEILEDLKQHQEKERHAEELKAIVDGVQQQNLVGAGVMNQHVPVNQQQQLAAGQPQPQQVAEGQPQPGVAGGQPQQVGVVQPQQVAQQVVGVQPQQVAQQVGGVQPQPVGVIQPQQAGMIQPQQAGVLQPQQVGVVQPQQVGQPVGVVQPQQVQQAGVGQPVLMAQPAAPAQPQQGIVQGPIDGQPNPGVVQPGAGQQPILTGLQQPGVGQPVQQPAAGQPVVQPAAIGAQPVVPGQQVLVPIQPQQVLQPAVAPQQPQLVQQQQQQFVQQPVLVPVGQQQPGQQQPLQQQVPVQQPLQMVQQQPQQQPLQQQVPAQQPLPMVQQQPQQQPLQQQVPEQQPLQMVQQPQQQPLQQQVPAQMVQQQPQVPQQRVLQEPVIQPLRAQPVQQDNVADYESVPNRDNIVKETVVKSDESDAKVPGRDLKENPRIKRDTLCENNPDCDGKFNRDPVNDYNRDKDDVAILHGRELLSQKTGDSDVEP